MEGNIKSLENRLTGVEDNLKDMGELLRQIKESLMGNDFNKTGIIHTIAEHHQRLNTLERQFDRTKYMIIGLSMGTGGFLWEVIKGFFDK